MESALAPGTSVNAWVIRSDNCHAVSAATKRKADVVISGISNSADNLGGIPLAAMAAATSLSKAPGPIAPMNSSAAD